MRICDSLITKRGFSASSERSILDIASSRTHELLTPGVATAENSFPVFSNKTNICRQTRCGFHIPDDIVGPLLTRIVRAFATMASATDTKNYKFNHTMYVGWPVCDLNYAIPADTNPVTQDPSQGSQGVRCASIRPQASQKHTHSPSL